MSAYVVVMRTKTIDAKFPNVKAAKDWYYSEAYRGVAKHRKRGGDLSRPDC
jgi:uncharacterized protein (DUF1330 family)